MLVFFLLAEVERAFMVLVPEIAAVAVESISGRREGAPLSLQEIEMAQGRSNKKVNSQ